MSMGRGRAHNELMRWLIAVLLVCPWLLPAASAMSFELKTLPLGSSGAVQAVFLEGAVQEGDAQKFQQFLAGLDPSVEQSTLWLALNSEGGSLRETLTIARHIRNRGFITHVPAESRCISACIFLYAAGLVRVPGLTAPNTPFKPASLQSHRLPSQRLGYTTGPQGVAHDSPPRHFPVPCHE